MAKRVLSVAAVSGLVVVMLVLAGAKSGHAQVFPTSDRPAGYVVFPKVVVDTRDFYHLERRIDTLIQLTNVAHDVAPGDGNRTVQCNYVDATSHCDSGANAGLACRDDGDCPNSGVCVPGWSSTDFTLVLTANQPVGWRASDVNGLVPAPEDPFVGELKCVEVDPSVVGASARLPRVDDLKGEATIEEVNSGAAGSVDARQYNAIGFRQGPTASGYCVGGTNDGQAGCPGNCPGGGCTVSDNQLCLGASPGSVYCKVAEYASCPAILIVDHFFDDAVDPVNGSSITTDLTLVPCTENLGNGTGIDSQTPTTAQILVFNEFEQRFSTSTGLNCFMETQLSDIDTVMGPAGNSQSIFNVAVQGTLTGQTRIRPVLSADPNHGNGLLAIAEEFHGSKSAAYNVDYVGINAAKGDIVTLH